MPVSAQTVWQILNAEGLPRLPRRDDGRRGPPTRLDPVEGCRPARLACRTAVAAVRSRRAAAALPRHLRCRPCPGPWYARPANPSTEALSSWQSIGTLLLAKCARKVRISHAGTLADDQGLAFTLGLTALPKATHLGTYSWRVRRDSNRALLSGLVKALAGRSAWPPARPDSTATSTPSATTATRPSWKSTTCPAGPSAPAPC